MKKYRPFPAKEAWVRLFLRRSFRSFVRSLARLFHLPFVHSFVRSLVCLFIRLFIESNQLQIIRSP